MMYENKFITCVKVNGQILRENKDTVFVPFGSEFALFFKNLNSVRAVVSVSIDGNDVLSGDQLVVNANSSVDLERFMGSNSSEGRRFKFIERTSEIENHRGIGGEDGLIRIEFQYEQPQQFVSPNQGYYPFPMYPPGVRSQQDTMWSAGGHGATRGVTHDSYTAAPTNTTLRSNSISSQAVNVAGAAAHSLNDAGITVEGSKSNQQFYTTSVNALEAQKHVIVLQLKGVSGDTVIQQPVTVKTRKTCPACGNTYKSSFEYCVKDGTYLRA